MTLQEVLKQSKYKEFIYVALYNKDNKRFFGAFAKDESLKEYNDYEVLEERKFSDFIYIVQLKEYTYSLGLDSIRFKESRNSSSNTVVILPNKNIKDKNKSELKKNLKRNSK